MRPRGLLLPAALVAACASPHRGPEATLEAYLAAAESGDAAAAWALMAEEYRTGVSETTFAARFEAAREQAVGRLRAARERGWSAPELSATLDAGGLDPVRLLRVDGRWLFADGVLEDYAQDTPRQAVRSFVRALESERWDVLLRFVPLGVRGDVDEATLREYGAEQKEALAAMLTRLRRHLDDPIDVDGDRAVLRYEGHECELLREDGAWRVADPD